MSGFEEEVNKITSFIALNYSATPVALDNDEIELAALNEWVRFSVQPYEAKNMGIGAEEYRYWGILYFQIFVRPNTGTGRTREIVDIFTAMFRDVNIGGITFKVPDFKLVGVNDGWHQSTMSVKYYREELSWP